MKQYLDAGFEVIATGLEMIDAVIEAHGTLFENQDDAKVKNDHPASFEDSLCLDDDDTSRIRGRR